MAASPCQDMKKAARRRLMNAAAAIV